MGDKVTLADVIIGLPVGSQCDGFRSVCAHGCALDPTGDGIEVAVGCNSALVEEVIGGMKRPSEVGVAIGAEHEHATKFGCSAEAVGCNSAVVEEGIGGMPRLSQACEAVGADYEPATKLKCIEAIVGAVGQVRGAIDNRSRWDFSEHVGLLYC